VGLAAALELGWLVLMMLSWLAESRLVTVMGLPFVVQEVMAMLLEGGLKYDVRVLKLEMSAKRNQRGMKELQRRLQPAPPSVVPGAALFPRPKP
jgi:hypothetical protein